MAEPTFLIIGAARSGTTSLYDYVGQHPDVYTSPLKEPSFFAVEGERLDYRGPGEGKLRWITDWDDYLALFDGVTSERAIGEASALYLYSERAPDRIRRHVPDVRLLAILRNPIERAFSAYSFLKERGAADADFLAALDAEDARVAANWTHIWHYRRMGYYHEQLGRYLERFDAEQLRVFLYEDLVSDPRLVVRQAFEHIGVDASFEPRTDRRLNVSGEPRFRLLAPLLTRNRVTSHLRPIVVRTLNPLVTRVKPRALARAPIPPEAVERLSDAYRTDVEQLGRLLGRDLSGWLAPIGIP